MHDASVEQNGGHAALEQPEGAEVRRREVQAAVMQETQQAAGDLQ